MMQEAFRRGQEITFTPSGTSMLPILVGDRDMVTLSPKPDRLRRYDVALYRRPKTNQLVLHRLIGFTDDNGFIFSGDNQYTYEYGIRDKDILALMTAFVHNGKEYRTNEFSYKLYIRCMMFKKRITHFSHRVYRFLKRA